MADEPRHAQLSLAQIAKRVPKGVVCLNLGARLPRARGSDAGADLSRHRREGSGAAQRASADPDRARHAGSAGRRHRDTCDRWHAGARLQRIRDDRGPLPPSRDCRRLCVGAGRCRSRSRAMPSAAAWPRRSAPSRGAHCGCLTSRGISARRCVPGFSAPRRGAAGGAACGGHGPAHRRRPRGHGPCPSPRRHRSNRSHGRRPGAEPPSVARAQHRERYLRLERRVARPSFVLPHRRPSSPVRSRRQTQLLASTARSTSPCPRCRRLRICCLRLQPPAPAVARGEGASRYRGRDSRSPCRRC